MIRYACVEGAVTGRERIGEPMRHSDSMKASSPASSGPAGSHFEGQVGAHYLLAMLIGAEPRGLPGTRIERVKFQRASEDHPLDDIVVHARDGCGSGAVLEIQAKRSLRFTKSDQRFRDVVAQIAKASERPGFVEHRHELAVAVGRAPLSVQGSLQDALKWARDVGSADTFMKRIKRPRSANDAMRGFVDAFKAHLEHAGAATDSETVRLLLARFQILQFDFTAQGSRDEAWQRERAAQALHADDAGRADALSRVLVELAIQLASSAGQLDRDELVQGLRSAGFRLAGDRRFSPARDALAEDARHALQDIADRVGQVRLRRAGHLATIRSALEQGRYVEIRGEPGVGKSGLLRWLAEERCAQSRIVVLSPGRVRPGGWGAMRAALGVQGTAREFLVDLASSGGGILFVDGLEAFSENERRTVVDLLREAADVPGFSVVATTRPGLGDADDEPEWLPVDAIDRLGLVVVTVEELDEDEVSELRDAAPELALLLADAHPAKPVVRNLFRLDRLARRPAGQTPVRTEVDMALDWWRTADGKEEGRHDRARVLKELAKQAVAGATLDASALSAAAVHALVKSQAIRDLGADKVMFGHDILRDWAVAGLIHDDFESLHGLPLDRPAPARIVRGFELGARMSLERADSDDDWRTFLDKVSQEGMHGSWRRAALLAVVRSEAGEELLQRAAASLLADDARLLVELMRAVRAAEVQPLSEVASAAGVAVPAATAGFHVPSGPVCTRFMRWTLDLGNDLPEVATNDAADFFNASRVGIFERSELGGRLAHWHYRRLEKLDARRTGRAASSLRSGFLSVCHCAPRLAAVYLRSLARCNAFDAAIRDVWKLSSVVAQAAPEELAELTLAMLIPEKRTRSSGRSQSIPSSMSELPTSEWDDPGRGPFELNDSEFAPPSPERGPFLALLEHAPEVGLKLVRQLVDHAISVRLRGRADGTASMTVHFPEGPREFPWTETYAWSRVWGNGDPCVQSALMAVETWAHRRIENGEGFASVLADVLPQDGGPAAYLLMAVDLVLSHWPKSAEAAIPFVGCPELLSLDLQRIAPDNMPIPDILGLDALLRETVYHSGSDSLKARASRRRTLASRVSYYTLSGPAEDRVELARVLKQAVERLGPYGDQADRRDPEFMAVEALNGLDLANWRKTSSIGSDGEPADAWEYVSPPEELKHLERLRAAASKAIVDRDMQISVLEAVEDQSRSSQEFASRAMDWALQPVPAGDGDGEDVRRRHLARTAAAVVAMRDGDEGTRALHREWARDVFLEAFAAERDTRLVPGTNLPFNPVAMAFVGTACLLRDGVEPEDVRTLLQAASRQDLLAASGFRAVAGMIAATDKRLPPALLRTAFASCICPRKGRSGAHRYGGDARRVSQAIDSEFRWLSGEGVEPQWPAFPPASPVAAQGSWMRPIDLALPQEDESAAARRQTGEILHHGSAALWLQNSSGLLDVQANPWLRDVARSYADWTAVANGRGFRRHESLTERPFEWNVAYYGIVAHCLPGLTAEETDQIALDPIRSLPDESFFDAASRFLRSVDQVHFGSGNLGEAEAVRIRASFAERLSESSGWRFGSSDPSGSTEVHVGSAIAAFFFNDWDRLRPSSCYLRSPGIDRIGPFLPPLERLATESPGGFVAGLVLDLVEVSPRLELLPLVTAAAEAWLEAHPDDMVFWEHNEIARRLCGVVGRIGSVEPYAAWDPSLRNRVAKILSTVAGLGVPEAVQLEQDLAGSDAKSL